jgi:hypothetical protein
MALEADSRILDPVERRMEEASMILVTIVMQLLLDCEIWTLCGMLEGDLAVPQLLCWSRGAALSLSSSKSSQLWLLLLTMTSARDDDGHTRHTSHTRV